MKKRYLGYAVLMLFSSLIRPESWLYSFGIVTFFYAVDTKRWNRFLWLPLAGPLLWVGFDYFTFGDPLFSLKMTSKYKDILGVTPLNFVELLVSLPKIISKAVGLSTLILAIASLAWSVSRSRAKDERLHWLFSIIIFLPVIFYLFMSAFSNIIFMERFLVFSNVLLIFYAFLSPNHIKTKPLYTTMISLGLFFILSAANINLNSIKKAVSDSEYERQKTTLVEKSIPLLRHYTDSLQANIIVPYRRKMATDYLLPAKYTAKLISFREIVYENAIHNVDIHRYSPAVALFIENDFTGLENGFAFLENPGIYRLMDYLALKPLVCGQGYTIYQLYNDTIWVSPMEFEIRSDTNETFPL
ncbi:hypothetical protein HZA73_02045 [candidate division TA06 bacterium]|nr:hypothetical protein [candidate division TA06 bacterium]